MADIDDRWHRKGPDGKPVRTERYGTGKRWLVRYRDPAGVQRKKAFERKKDAEDYAASIIAEVRSGTYIDPNAGRITVGAWLDAWLPTLGHLKESSRRTTVSTAEKYVRPRWSTVATPR